MPYIPAKRPFGERSAPRLLPQRGASQGKKRPFSLIPFGEREDEVGKAKVPKGERDGKAVACFFPRFYLGLAYASLLFPLIPISFGLLPCSFCLAVRPLLCLANEVVPISFGLLPCSPQRGKGTFALQGKRSKGLLRRGEAKQKEQGMEKDNKKGIKRKERAASFYGRQS